MDFFTNFLSILFYTLWIMIMIAFIILVIRIIVDIFRDEALSGFGKVGWLLLIALLPALGAIIYLVARGQGMANRDLADAKRVREAQVAYTQGLMGEAGAAGEIKAAKELLDGGAITQEEFDALKAKALA
jgi:energy-coupling factor transporter transmembrane protein EcfT